MMASNFFMVFGFTVSFDKLNRRLQRLFTIPGSGSFLIKASFFYFYALPERNMIGNLFGGLLGIFIGPSGIPVDVFSDSDVIIRSSSLPRTGGSGGRLLKKFPVK